MIEFNFKLTEGEVQIVVNGLNEIARKYSEPVIQKMQTQINEQLGKPPEPVKRAYKKRSLKLIPPQDQKNVVA